jgi:hypothetical protein
VQTSSLRTTRRKRAGGRIDCVRYLRATTRNAPNSSADRTPSRRSLRDSLRSALTGSSLTAAGRAPLMRGSRGGFARSAARRGRRRREVGRRPGSTSSPSPLRDRCPPFTARSASHSAEARHYSGRRARARRAHNVPTMPRRPASEVRILSGALSENPAIRGVVAFWRYALCGPTLRPAARRARRRRCRSSGRLR